MEKKKVLIFLYSPLINAGVPNVMLTLVKSLADKVDFTVLALDGGTLDSEFERSGAKIAYLTEKRPVSKWRRRIYDYTRRYKHIAQQLKVFLRENHFDAVHCSSGFDGGLYVRVAAKCGVPIRILHCHGKYPIKAHNFFKELQRNSYKKLIERFATVKLSCSKAAGETYFASPKETIVLVNPVDVEKYQGIVKKQSEKIRILQIGIFNSNKNQLFSLRLLKALRDRNVSAEMHFIGFDLSSAYGKEMLAYIQQNGLKKNVVFYAPNQDKKEVFADVDVLILPSHTEACPLVALEAQAAYVPVLASTNVPSDVDFGLCSYLSLDDSEEWLAYLEQSKTRAFVRAKEFLDITPLRYGEKLYKLYQGVEDGNHQAN